jgi:folate-binding protein YgfZ
MSSRKKRDINLPAPYLKRLWLDPDSIPDRAAYPFCLPFLHDDFEIRFDRAITIIVGENGTGKSTLLEGGFDELHGVSWTKGCYMGQELTARTKYRGLLKRRLVPVNVDGALPEPGTAVTRAGAQVGTMRSGRDGRGLALLQLDALDAPLTAAAALLRPDPPDWMTLSGRPAGQGTDQPAILTT